jgi:hypothetical protein
MDPEALLARLEVVYGEVDRRQKALKAIREIRQGEYETFAAFYPKFEAEMNDAGAEMWPEETKIDYLQGAINESLKSRLVSMDHVNTYLEFAQQCERISSRMELLGQWKPEKNGRTSYQVANPQHHEQEATGRRTGMMEWEPTGSAVPINATQMPNLYGYPSKRAEDQRLLGKRAKWVANEEIQIRRDEGRCLRCGRDGCRVAKCPLAAALKPKVKANKPRVRVSRAAVEEATDGEPSEQESEKE